MTTPKENIKRCCNYFFSADSPRSPETHGIIHLATRINGFVNACEWTPPTHTCGGGSTPPTHSTLHSSHCKDSLCACILKEDKHTSESKDVSQTSCASFNPEAGTLVVYKAAVWNVVASYSFEMSDYTISEKESKVTTVNNLRLSFMCNDKRVRQTCMPICKYSATTITLTLHCQLLLKPDDICFLQLDATHPIPIKTIHMTNCSFEGRQLYLVKDVESMIKTDITSKTEALCTSKTEAKMDVHSTSKTEAKIDVNSTEKRDEKKEVVHLVSETKKQMVPPVLDAKLDESFLDVVEKALEDSIVMVDEEDDDEDDDDYKLALGTKTKT
jgi:hypothetical protein